MNARIHHGNKFEIKDDKLIKLVTYPPAFGEPSASPFSIKAICLLQMSGQEWERKITSDPRKAPKAKLPLIDDGGTVIADSDMIRDYLEITYGVDFDAGLNDQQKAVSRAVIRMVEEHTYFALVCDRWMNDNNWPHIKKAFFAHIPKLINGFVTKQIRKQALNQVHQQGMARHSFAEQAVRAGKDISAIETLLGDKAFLFGDTPTAADASVVPMLRAIAASPTETALSDIVKGNDKLMAYLDRGRDALYPA